MIVLSLFDGISCGRVALDRAGIKVEKYYASEIDKYATAISQKNFPDIIRLGDINNWRTWSIDWASIDLLIGGSPCQGFSFAGKQLNFEDPRSKLFFVYADILKHIKTVNPNIKFLLENVKMKKEFQDIISDYLGVQPVAIDSNLVSAQNRKRLYWANWEFSQPEDKGIMLKDIIHENTETDREKAYALDASYMNAAPSDYINRGRRQHVYQMIAEYIVPFDKTLQILDKEVEKGKIGYFRKDSQANRVYYINGKAVTLCGDAGGGAAKMGQYLFGHIQTPRGKNNGGLKEREKAPSITSNHWEQNNRLLLGCIAPEFINRKAHGPRFNDENKCYTLTTKDRHGILIEGYIRKLTPIECERLQTLPDDFTKCDGISNSQRYKTLGNGWTVDVIAHTFKALKENVALNVANQNMQHLVYPPRHDKTAYELQLKNNKLEELLKECKTFLEEENPNDFTVLSERMDELLTKIETAI